MWHKHSDRFLFSSKVLNRARDGRWKCKLDLLHHQYLLGNFFIFISVCCMSNITILSKSKSLHVEFGMHILWKYCFIAQPKLFIERYRQEANRGRKGIFKVWFYSAIFFLETWPKSELCEIHTPEIWKISSRGTLGA